MGQQDTGQDSRTSDGPQDIVNPDTENKGKTQRRLVISSPL
jgi:hypothetical protein